MRYPIILHPINDVEVEKQASRYLVEEILSLCQLNLFRENLKKALGYNPVGIYSKRRGRRAIRRLGITVKCVLAIPEYTKPDVVI